MMRALSGFPLTPRARDLADRPPTPAVGLGSPGNAFRITLSYYHTKEQRRRGACLVAQQLCAPPVALRRAVPCRPRRTPHSALQPAPPVPKTGVWALQRKQTGIIASEVTFRMCPDSVSQDLQRKLFGVVDRISDRLIGLSDRIGRQPELGFQEQKASAWHAAVLEEAGFTVQQPYAGMATAFRAEVAGCGPGPAVALLVEYDALPEIGHACGHNLHGTISTGAGAALAAIRAEWPGRLVVLGTPAEEGAVDGAGGKVVMVEEDAFEGIDAALMVHCSSKNILGTPTLAREAFEMTFRGKAAHAAAIPHQGVNALEAAMLTFGAINALRQHLTPDVRIHGIITKGGVSPNIVPELAEVRMYARAADKGYLREVMEKIRNCARGAALATGAKFTLRSTAHPYDNMIASAVLTEVWAASMARLGAKVHADPGRGSGSTDMGNVSQVVPAIHPYIAICDEPIPGHSREFAQAAVSERGHQGLVLGTKALALTALRLLTEPELLQRAGDEFARRTKAEPGAG